MSIPVNKFNPRKMTEEEILALSTGREKLFNFMVSEMSVCLKEGSNQHFVIYGPRGIGKSFFIRRLKIHHDSSDEFKKSLFIQLPEEQENINFVSDLLNVISILLEGGKLVEAVPRWTSSPLQWEHSVKRLRSAIAYVAAEKGIKHIFVAQENLQAFIPKLDPAESGRMRTFLSDFEEITLIGSSLRPDLDTDYSKRLFQVFKKMDLEPWKPEDFLGYYEKMAKLSGRGLSQPALLKRSENKIRAISRFTGGSPRLAVILTSLILDREIPETARILDGIIDDLTSYYQDITEDIPQKSRILFDMLIRKGENITQSALAAAFDPPLDQSTIARSFSWLLDNYYVVFQKQNKGNTKYFFVRDRLYVLYYQKRQIYADVPYSVVGVFVNFLNEFYSKNERKEAVEELNPDHQFSKPLLYHLAKKANAAINEENEASFVKDKILSVYSTGEEENPSRVYEPGVAGLSSEADCLLETGNNHFEKGAFKKAIDAYKKAIQIKPYFAEAYFNLGTAHGENGDFSNAITAFIKAVELAPDVLVSLENALKLIIQNNAWEQLDKLNKFLNGQETLSSVLGNTLSEVIQKNESDKFYLFKNTLDSVQAYTFINRHEVVNALCLSVYNQGDLSFLKLIIEELGREKEGDPILPLILQVFSYLVEPGIQDINQLHPDVRTVVESVLERKV